MSTVSDTLTSLIVATLYKATKILAGITISLATFGLVALYKYQNYLIYPSYMNEGRTYHNTPEAFGIKFEHVKLKTRDKETLDCFVLKHDENSQDYIKKTVVLLGPNAGNMSHYLPIAEIIYKNYGYNVFLYSYRGYGNSTGDASEKGLMIDAETVLEYLAGDKQLSQTSIILYGRSLGGAVAIYMASFISKQKGDLGISNAVEVNETKQSIELTRAKVERRLNVAGVILENTFLNITKVIPYIFPLLKRVAPLCTETWPSEKRIVDIDPEIPMLFLNGQQDEIVPPDHMDTLFELSRSTDKAMHKFPEGNHNDTCNQPGYWNLVREFTSRAVKPFD